MKNYKIEAGNFGTARTTWDIVLIWLITRHV